MFDVRTVISTVVRNLNDISVVGLYKISRIARNDIVLGLFMTASTMIYKQVAR